MTWEISDLKQAIKEACSSFHFINSSLQRKKMIFGLAQAFLIATISFDEKRLQYQTQFTSSKGN